MTWALIASILTSLAGIFGGVRWLLAVYFKQQIKLDAARKDAFTAQAELLKNETVELKNTIRFHREQLRIVLVQSETAIKEFSDSKEAAQRVYQTLREFVSSTEERFRKIENGHPEEKPEPLPVKETPKENIGKVIVKK